MSIGSSGRIVFEVDPDMKRRLYAVLASNGLTLKAWFIHEASSYIENAGQGQLFVAASWEAEPDTNSHPGGADVTP